MRGGRGDRDAVAFDTVPAALDTAVKLVSGPTGSRCQ
jgi:hypothetical protein